MVSCSANAVTDGDTRGLVALPGQEHVLGPAGVKVMNSIGAKKVVVLAQQNPFVVAMIEPFKAEMAKLGGSVLDVVMYNSEQPYRAEVRGLRRRSRTACSACPC